MSSYSSFKVGIDASVEDTLAAAKSAPKPDAKFATVIFHGMRTPFEG